MTFGEENRSVEIIKSANQIVSPKYREVQKCCTVFDRPPFPLGGGPVSETTSTAASCRY